MGFFILYTLSILHIKGVATLNNKNKKQLRIMDATMNTTKYVDMDKEYASKAVGGTALGLSIGALGLEFLKNGGLQNVLGGLTGNNNVPFEESAFGLYKNQRDQYDELLSKHNKDAFDLYKNQRDGYDVLKSQIDAINTKMAIAETNIAWQNKNVMDAIALEAERRACNDGKIVNYMNTTFAPKYIADFTIGSGSTQASIFNPLCGCSLC